MSDLHELKTLNSEICERIKGLEAKLNPQEKKSLGQQFIESEIGQEIFKNTTPTANAAAQKKFSVKNITNDPASAGPAAHEYREPQIFGQQFNQNRIQSIIPSTATTQGVVEVVRLDSFDNQAAPQAGHLTNKPKSDMTFAMTRYTLETFAHWVQASRQILTDQALLADEIDTHLSEGLHDLLATQVLYGDGVGNNLTGLMVDTNVTDIGVRGSSGYAKHIRSAFTGIERAGFMPDWVAVSPEGWANLEMESDSTGRYLWSNPQNAADKRLWGTRVLSTPGLLADDFVVGNFARGSRLYDRGTLTIRVSDQHGDVFIQNGVAILAELETTFAVTRPAAFAKGSLAAA